MDSDHGGSPSGALPPTGHHRPPFEAVGHRVSAGGAFPDEFPSGQLASLLRGGGGGGGSGDSSAESVSLAGSDSTRRAMHTVPPPTAFSSLGDASSLVDEVDMMGGGGSSVGGDRDDGGSGRGGPTPSLRSYHSRSLSLSTRRTGSSDVGGGGGGGGGRPGSIRSRAASRAATSTSRRASVAGAAAGARAASVLAPGDGHAEDLRVKELAMFEWSGGGRMVFLVGNWDGYTDRVPMESVKTGCFRAAVEVPVGRLEYKFIVDGKEKYNPDAPTAVDEATGVRVNVRHGDDTLPAGVLGAGGAVDGGAGGDGSKGHPSRRRRLMSRISGLDLYSEFSVQQVVSMFLFRLFYLAMIPAGGYYFYWLIARGGNENAPVNWIVFITAEMLSYFSAIISLFGMWKPVKRRWRSLDSLRPALPEADWPTVDVIICHYKEDTEQLRQTIRAAMKLDYPAHLLHILIADDGFFPTSKLVERSDIGLALYQTCVEEAGYDPLVEETMNEKGLVEHYTVKAGDELPRHDCAVEAHQFEFGPYGADMYAPGALPRLSLVARVKPADAHNKAGNINNVLSNSNADGKIVLFLDADMKPVESYLLRVLPLLLEEQRSDSLQSQLIQAEDPELGAGTSKSWQINRDIGFVGCPQRFANVSGDHPDYCAHRNAIYYDGICTGRDGFGMTDFVGTNACWRREVLNEIGGFVYGSVTEDTLTSNEVHRRGYISRYADEDLCWGEAPVTVAAALLQRQRWAKGAIMNGLRIFKGAAKERKEMLLSRGKPSELSEFYAYRRQQRKPNNAFVSTMFWLDSTLYPLLGWGAFAYVFCAITTLITAAAPISPTSLQSLGGAFVTYYFIRYGAFFSAFYEVDMTDVLRSQQCWFSYSFAHTVGVWDALFGGSKFGWVANTGQRHRRSWLEWFNILTLGALLGGIVWRLIAFIVIDEACAPYENFGAVAFGGYVAWMMAPVALVSLNERLSSADESEREGKPLPVPTPIIAAAVTILGVVFLSGWANARCGIEARG